MAEVKPFRGWHYNPEKIARLSEVVVPPYDVISEKELAHLQRLNPFNFSKVILPEGENKHQKAADLFQQWKSQKIFVQDPKANLYFYRQKFTLDPYERFCQKATASSLSRTGIFSRVALEDYKTKVILPHEKTFAGPKQDRYLLMEAAKGNLEPVFLGYDSSSFSGGEFEQIVGSRKPLFEYSDFSGVQHELWPIDDQKISDDVAKKLARETFYILDGHHRYETALQFFKDHRSEEARYVLAQICSFNQPGTVILPTHRLIRGVKNFDASVFVKKLKSFFDLLPVGSPHELEVLLRDSGRGAFGLLLPGEARYSFLRLREGVALDTRLKLDLDILHGFILKTLLGSEMEISYIKSIPEFEMRMKNKEFQMGFLVKPSTYEEVMDTARHFEKMPHKSTFFYPKIPSGLVVNLFE